MSTDQIESKNDGSSIDHTEDDNVAINLFTAKKQSASTFLQTVEQIHSQANAKSLNWNYICYDYCNQNGKSLMYSIFEKYSKKVTAKICFDMAHSLFKAGADPNAILTKTEDYHLPKSSMYWTPLLYAIEKRWLEMVKLLIENFNANPNVLYKRQPYIDKYYGPICVYPFHYLILKMACPLFKPVQSFHQKNNFWEMLKLFLNDNQTDVDAIVKAQETHIDKAINEKQQQRIRQNRVKYGYQYQNANNNISNNNHNQQENKENSEDKHKLDNSDSKKNREFYKIANKKKEFDWNKYINYQFFIDTVQNRYVTIGKVLFDFRGLGQNNNTKLIEYLFGIQYKRNYQIKIDIINYQMLHINNVQSFIENEKYDKYLSQYGNDNLKRMYKMLDTIKYHHGKDNFDFESYWDKKTPNLTEMDRTIQSKDKLNKFNYDYAFSYNETHSPSDETFMDKNPHAPVSWFGLAIERSNLKTVQFLLQKIVTYFL